MATRNASKPPLQRREPCSMRLNAYARRRHHRHGIVNDVRHKLHVDRHRHLAVPRQQYPTGKYESTRQEVSSLPAGHHRNHGHVVLRHAPEPSRRGRRLPCTDHSSHPHRLRRSQPMLQTYPRRPGPERQRADTVDTGILRTTGQSDQTPRRARSKKTAQPRSDTTPAQSSATKRVTPSSFPTSKVPNAPSQLQRQEPNLDA